MGVYINMEMPKDGVYWCEIGVADDIAMITIHGEDRKSFPLVPVPPHGDLIDKDATMNEILEQRGEDTACWFAGIVNDMTAIIPSDKAEEGEA